MSTKHSYIARVRIARRARKKLRVKQDPGEKYIFMQQCISELMDQGEIDDDSDARDICELLWSEGEDAFSGE